MTEIRYPYKPMPKQAQAHALASKYRSFVGGWGNGKTSWGCAETFVTLHEFPGTHCVIARKTRPELKATTWDMFMNGDKSHPTAWQGIPKESIRYLNKSDLILEFQCGSKVWGLPLDDPKKIENYNLGFYWIDQAEEVEEDIFLKFQGRLRQNHAPREGILSWNPNGHNWLWRRFIDPDRPEKWKGMYQAIEATTFDNPNLPEDYLDQFSGLPEAWLQRFVMGSHDVFVGQIFTDWNPSVHIIQPFRIPSTWQRWSCHDPGIRHEGAAVWVARDHLGNCYYYREHLEANQPVEWWAGLTFELEQQEDLGGPYEEIHRRLIGPEARQRAQTDGRTVVDLFEEYGLYPEIADRSPAARISKITEYLRPKEDHFNPFTNETPAPRLYVFSTCTKLQEYLPQYRWVPQRTNFTEEEAAERPRKKDDHNIDCLGHILLAMEQTPLPDPDPAVIDYEKQMVQELMDECYADAVAAADSRWRHDVLGGV